MNKILYLKVNNHNKLKIEKQELWSNLHLKKTTKSNKTFYGKVQTQVVATTNKPC